MRLYVRTPRETTCEPVADGGCAWHDAYCGSVAGAGCAWHDVQTHCMRLSHAIHCCRLSCIPSSIAAVS